MTRRACPHCRGAGAHSGEATAEAAAADEEEEEGEETPREGPGWLLDSTVRLRRDLTRTLDPNSNP